MEMKISTAACAGGSMDFGPRGTTTPIGDACSVVSVLSLDPEPLQGIIASCCLWTARIVARRFEPKLRNAWV